MRYALILSLLAAVPALAQTPGVSGTLEQAGAVSPQEKLAFGTAAVAEIGEAVTAVEELKAEAEKEKQVEVVECLTPKLTTLKALSEVSRGSAASLQQLVGANDTVHADLEYRKIAVALSKARDVLAEAQACAWQSGAKRGEAVVSVDDEEVADDIPLVDVPTVVEPPYTPN